MNILLTKGLGPGRYYPTLRSSPSFPGLFSILKWSVLGNLPCSFRLDPLPHFDLPERFPETWPLITSGQDEFRETIMRHEIKDGYRRYRASPQKRTKHQRCCSSSSSTSHAPAIHSDWWRGTAHRMPKITLLAAFFRHLLAKPIALESTKGDVIISRIW